MSSAYITYFYAVMIVAISFIWIMLSKFVNEFIININPLIEDGQMTTIFVQNWNFTIAVFTAIPLIALLSLVLWGFVRTIEERGGNA